MPSLNGKTALVTGASRGMGRASALALAAAGAQVLVHYGRGAKEADGVVAEIRKAGGRADAIATDLAAADGASKLAKQARSIINVSSTYGQTGAAGASIYAASKHAVVGLTQSAALEAAESGVRVNAVAPGPIDTGMLTRFTGTDERKAGLVSTVPLKRLGKPEEIAQTIVFLASDKAAFSTGATFAVDDGKTAQ